MSMDQAIDVDAYFKRIDYGGSASATLDTLREIVRLHTQTIPFENLNPLARVPVDIASAGLQRKLIDDRRGGYCFEHNSLLSNVLRQLGYPVAGLAARVLWNRPVGASLPPRTHMVLRVEVDGESYIVDVGFGGMTLTGVLRFVPDIEQATPHEPYRLLRASDVYAMQASVQSEWRTMYQFDLQEQTSADYELMNWYTSAHPNSHFITHLGVARTAPGRRYSLRNREFSIHHLDAPSEHRSVASVRELRELFDEVFLLRAPVSESLDAALRRVLQIS